MLQLQRRTLAMQQQLTSKRLGPADATQPKPPPSPEPETTIVSPITACSGRSLSRDFQVPCLDDMEAVIQQQSDAVSRHTDYLNDLHSRCATLHVTSASCLRGLPIVHRLLQVPSSTCPSLNAKPLTFFSAA